MTAVGDRRTAPTGREPAGAEPLYAGYFALQAVAGVAVWMVVSASPTARSWVELRAGAPQVTDAFFLADMVVVATSAVAAWTIWMRRPSALLWSALTAGGVLYPTMYLLSWVMSDEQTGAAPLALMLAVTSLTFWALAGVWRSTRPRER